MNFLPADYTGWLWTKLDIGPQSYQTTVSGTGESASEPGSDTLPNTNTCAEVILIIGSAGTVADIEPESKQENRLFGLRGVNWQL